MFLTGSSAALFRHVFNVSCLIKKNLTMDPACKDNDTKLPLPALQLLVSPMRLMSACMWRVAQQCNVKHYGKLAEFIRLVTKIVPELLSPSQRAQLILGLKARLVLELCQGESVPNLDHIQYHLDEIHTCVLELNSVYKESSTETLKGSYTNFATLVHKLINVPDEKEYFFQEVFPSYYGFTYDLKLQKLLAEFLSRIEQLLPQPDFTQTAEWLTEMPALELVGQLLSEPSALTVLLLHHKQLGTLSSGSTCTEDDSILSSLALAPELAVGRHSDPYSEDKDCDLKEVLLMDSDEDSNLSANIVSESPTKRSGLLSKLFICPHCSFADRIKGKVQEHIQAEHQASDPCPMRGTFERKTLRTPKDRIVKIRTANIAAVKKPKPKKDPSGNETEQCDSTEPKGADGRFLSSRLRAQNFTTGETQCPQCAKAFDLPNQLKTHLRLHTMPYHCSQCEKGFTSKSGFYQHQRLHKRGRIYKCAHCSQGFLCTYSLKQHERLHTEGHGHLCAICGKRFSKVAIVRHMNMHKGTRNYLCTTCGKSFLSSGELLVHTRSHTGETPYTCTHCGKGFSSASHLGVHTRSHTGVRPYACAQCTRCFVTTGSLKRHMLCHDGVKPYKCPHCAKDFSQNGNLKRHLKTHQPDT